MDHLCPLLLLLLCAFAYFPVAFIEPEKQIMLNMYVIRSKEFSYFLFENLYLSLSVYLPTCLPTYLPISISVLLWPLNCLQLSWLKESNFLSFSLNIF